MIMRYHFTISLSEKGQKVNIYLSENVRKIHKVKINGNLPY